MNTNGVDLVENVEARHVHSRTKNNIDQLIDGGVGILYDNFAVGKLVLAANAARNVFVEVLLVVCGGKKNNECARNGTWVQNGALLQRPKL